MPTMREILYGLFIVICLLLAGWFILEIVDRIDDEAFIRFLIGG